jgi:hypothetical protein
VVCFDGWDVTAACGACAVGRTYGIVLKARQKETGAIVAIKKFKVRW